MYNNMQMSPRYSSVKAIGTTAALMHTEIYQLGNPNRSFFTKPTPNTYLLVTEEAPPFVRLGTKAKQMAGFHVIRGEW